jgi:hypothetical protein
VNLVSGVKYAAPRGKLAVLRLTSNPNPSPNHNYSSNSNPNPNLNPNPYPNSGPDPDPNPSQTERVNESFCNLFNQNFSKIESEDGIRYYMPTLQSGPSLSRALLVCISDALFTCDSQNWIQCQQPF